MSGEISQADLMAYLDEALPPGEMAAIEIRIRDDEKLVERLQLIHKHRDSGVHSLGDIWRRHRIGCASREQLGSYLLGVLEDGESEAIDFHIQQIGCRYCSANLEDLRQAGEESDGERRRRRYFQSSAGQLRRPKSR